MIVKRKKSYIRLEEEENTSYSCVVKVVNVQTIFFCMTLLYEKENKVKYYNTSSSNYRMSISN